VLLAEGGGGGPLQVGVDGELHLMGPQVASQEGEEGGGQRAVVTGAQVVGVARLHAGVPEEAAGIADRMGVQALLRVDPGQ